MFGEKRAMDSGWADRAQQQIQDRNAWAYNKMLNAAKDSYANRSASNDAWWDQHEKNPILRAIGKADTRLINLLSGQGTEKSFLEQKGFTPEIQEAGAAGNVGASDLGDYLGGVSRANTQAMNTGTGAVAGLNNIPVVGGILNYLTAPVAQLAGAGRDLQTGAQGDWNRWNQRDHVSDTAALGKVALEALTAGMGTPATLGAKVGFGMATGAADNALDTIREQGSQMNAGDVLKSAVIGAAFGGAIPIAGNAIGNITQRGAVKSVNNALRNAGFGSNLDDAGMYAAGQNVLGDQYQSLLSQANSGIRNKLTNFATGALPNSRLGKMAAIGGGTALGGYGLSKLFGGNNTQQMINDIKLGGEYLSDEDLAALYNYYGIGG